jgi:hypothetical protein
LKFLKWNYEQCKAGYHSRDQMVNDIFYKLSQIFPLYIGLGSIPFLVKFPANYIRLYLIFVLISGVITIWPLLWILSNMIQCKIILRQQCEYLEDKIRSDYLTGSSDIFFENSIYKKDRFNMHWECIRCRDSCFLFPKGKVDEEKKIIVWAALMLLLFWVIIIFSLIVDPGIIANNFSNTTSTHT